MHGHLSSVVAPLTAVRRIIGTCQARLHLIRVPRDTRRSVKEPAQKPAGRLRAPALLGRRETERVESRRRGRGVSSAAGIPFPWITLPRCSPDRRHHADPANVLFCMSLVGSRRYRGLPIERLKRAINLGQTARRTARLPSRTLARAFLSRIALPPASCFHHKAARRGGRETALLKGPEERFVDRERPPARGRTAPDQ